ncbi:alpha-2-macroglobulin family protein [Ditylenchus destructor]|uniref:Alpha-2-macroglobulin family protein n=1 Tax=Ditylenchus destructor TaxID=166010 RepID=A0AAD4MY94_9BILA|nr:alpha-2-macroglobulin family protein [Ditylenchus destructor]
MCSSAICFIFILIFLAFGHATSQASPFVLFPPALYFDSSNYIYVTPVIRDIQYVNITLSISDSEQNVYNQALLNRPSTETSKFDVRLGRGSRPIKYFIEIYVSGHDTLHSTIFGAPNVLNIRALPLTHQDELYEGDVEFQLLDPKGFKIFNKVSKADNRFIATSFTLPPYLRFGEWKVVSFAKDSAVKFHTVFYVNDYVLPKYRVFLTVEATKSPLIVKASVFARFAHGNVVNGDVTLRCSLISSRETTNVGVRSAPPSSKKLVSAQVGFYNEYTNT